MQPGMEQQAFLFFFFCIIIFITTIRSASANIDHDKNIKKPLPVLRFPLPC